jgi:pimeloyl-ACP methyl ester carboxylesterase
MTFKRGIYMRIFFKITKLALIFLSMLILILLVVFYRPDLSLNQLEDKYFTEFSHYYTAVIQDLENQELEINIHYIDIGNENDSVIVLLHGAFSSSHTFLPWAYELEGLGYRILLIDLPYHGLSSGFTDQVASIRRSAAVIKNLLDFLEVQEIFIGGNSMGGGVSWMFAGLYHGDLFQVRGVILIDAIFPNSQSGRPERLSFLTQPLISNIASQMTPKFLLKWILQGVYGSESSLEKETLMRYYELLRKQGNRIAILTNTQETMELDQQLSILNRLQEESIPVLIMWGEEDSWIPVSVAQLFKEQLNLPDENIIIYTGLGHVPMEEDPMRTLVDLISFLSQ